MGMYSSITCMTYGTALFETSILNFIHSILSCSNWTLSLRCGGTISLDLSSIRLYQYARISGSRPSRRFFTPDTILPDACLAACHQSPDFVCSYRRPKIAIQFGNFIICIAKFFHDHFLQVFDPLVEFVIQPLAPLFCKLVA